jgi:hypothetical protein
MLSGAWRENAGLLLWRKVHFEPPSNRKTADGRCRDHVRGGIDGGLFHCKPRLPTQLLTGATGKSFFL